MHCDLDLLTSKYIGHILGSWGVCMWTFMKIGVKRKQLCAGNHFQSFMHCDLDLWTSKYIGHILASWGVCMWSFMMIGVKRKQLCAGNHFQSFMHCDLDLWPFDLNIYRAHPWLIGSLHVKFHDDRCKGKAVMRRKPFSVIYALWPRPLTFWPQNL